MTTTSANDNARVRAAERRLLRVGIIQGQRIVEERLLAGRADVTIGSSPRSTFIVPSDHLPPRWRLFEERGGRRFLRLGAEMSARIAAGGEVTSFDAPAAGAATRPIPLPDGARGRVMVGDAAVLFQLVRPPAPKPRPQLPHAVRRRLSAEIDGLFAAVLAATLILHVVVVVYLRQVDWPRRPPIEEVPDRFIRGVAMRPRPIPPAPARAGAPTTPAPVAARPTPPPRAPRPPAERPTVSETERRTILEHKVQNLGLIPLITARTADGRSPLADLLSSGAVDRPLDEAFRGVDAVRVASTDSLRNLGRPGSEHGRVARVEDLRVGPITDAKTTGPAVERGVKPTLRVDPPVVDGGRLDPAVLAREIRDRRKSIAACYERALKQRPTLAGKLVVRFTITAAGTVSAAEIDDDTMGSPDVAGCVRALVLRWRFPAPADAPVEVSFPFVFQAGE